MEQPSNYHYENNRKLKEIRSLLNEHDLLDLSLGFIPQHHKCYYSEYLNNPIEYEVRWRDKVLSFDGYKKRSIKWDVNEWKYFYKSLNPAYYGNPKWLGCSMYCAIQRNGNGLFRLYSSFSYWVDELRHKQELNYFNDSNLAFIIPHLETINEITDLTDELIIEIKEQHNVIFDEPTLKRYGKL